jgi:glycosyltransferase involved in cell wall biosynthesis
VTTIAYPVDDGGCGHYRLIFPAETVGVPAPQFDDTPELSLQIGWSEPFGELDMEWHRPISIENLPDADVFVFQRCLASKYQHVFPLLKAEGRKVVVDIDDHFDRVDVRNVAWFDIEPHWLMQWELEQIKKRFGRVVITKKNSRGTHAYAPEHLGRANRVHLNRALKHADLITCSTPVLAKYYSRFGPTMVVRNAVPSSYVELGLNKADHPSTDTPVVTWTGSIQTHANDLNVMGAALRELRAEGVEFVFRIVGTGVGIADAIGIEPDEVTGWVDFHDYGKAYAQADIALCPLTDNEFNRGKSWLKMLEAAAVGVVPVASPLPEYEALHAMGVGRIAKKQRLWKSHLRELITNHDLRRQLQLDGLQVAIGQTYDARMKEWERAWS